MEARHCAEVLGHERVGLSGRLLGEPDELFDPRDASWREGWSVMDLDFDAIALEYLTNQALPYSSVDLEQLVLMLRAVFAAGGWQ